MARKNYQKIIVSTGRRSFVSTFSSSHLSSLSFIFLKIISLSFLVLSCQCIFNVGSLLQGWIDSIVSDTNIKPVLKSDMWIVLASLFPAIGLHGLYCDEKHVSTTTLFSPSFSFNLYRIQPLISFILCVEPKRCLVHSYVVVVLFVVLFFLPANHKPFRS